MKTPQKITKGVIAVAGSGTRFLPATKSLPKEMLLLIDKPIVHYVVEEMVDAGITDIVMVTRSDKKVLEDYFDHNVMLENELYAANKLQELEEIQRISEMANFIYIRQKGPYGNGTPVMNASSIVGNEPFVFAYGDDLVKSKVSFTKQLIENYEKNKTVVMGCQEVSKEEIKLYSSIKFKEGSPCMEIEEIIEKPEPEEAPSMLSNFGRFILLPEICEILRNFYDKRLFGKGGELWLTDAIQKYIDQGNRVVVQPVQDGKWFTTGDPLNFLKATIQYALERDRYKGEFREYLLRTLQEYDRKS
jgi:UTP--glucose-1-phosphate uridylyltransferase